MACFYQVFSKLVDIITWFWDCRSSWPG